MTIEEAMELIHGVEWRGSRPGLTRVRELLHRLGDPAGRTAIRTHRGHERQGQHGGDARIDPARGRVHDGAVHVAVSRALR